MKKILIIVLLVGLANHFQNDIKRFFDDGLFDSAGKPRTVLFTQPGCNKPCEDARRNLDQRDVAYEEVDLDQDRSLLKEIGLPATLPFLVVGYDKVYGYNPGLYGATLAANFGEQVLTSTEQRIFSEHFDENGEPKIVLYGTTWCGYCTKLRNDFNENNVDFVDYDVEKPAKKVWLLEALRIQGYPTVYIGYRRVNGSDYKAVMAAL